MSKQYRGAFYLKRTENGNLFGEYIEEGEKRIMTETAVPYPETLYFAGKYTSIWFFNDAKSSREAELTITPKKNLYRLTWEVNKVEKYKGQGMVVNDMLIGYYHSTDT